MTQSTPLLRVAFLSEHASPLALLGGEDAGGQNVYVDAVSRQVAAQGIQVDIFTRRDSPRLVEVVPLAPGVRVIHLDAGPARAVPKDDLWPYMGDFEEAFLRFTGRHHIRYALLHGNFWMSGWVAARLGQRLDIPVAQIFHAMGKTKQREQGSADTSPVCRIAIEREIVQRVDRLIAQCPSERDELVRDYGADPHKVALIPSAVDVNLFTPIPRDEARRRIGLDDKGNVIAYVGRMLPRKDIRNVVEALAILRQRANGPQHDARLLIVGGETNEPDPRTTPEIGVLVRMAAERGLSDQVIFTGRRPRHALRDYYCASNVVVTTPWYEPFGLTPLEAMACGRPVIGSRVGGVAFTVVDGATGYLVPPRDPPALAARLEHLLAHPALAARMEQAARSRVEREFTWEQVGQRTVELYRALLPAVTGMPEPRAWANVEDYEQAHR
jgi:D-inositol-3-phosphate glycosyltransferase